MIEEVLIIGLAAWRLAVLIVAEDGPFQMFAKLRRLAGVRAGREITGLAFALTCVWCMSAYTAAAGWLTWELISPWPVLFFAAWGAALALDSLTRRT